MANETPDYSYYDAVLKYLELKYEPYHHNKRAEKPPDNNGGDIDYSYYEAVLKYHELTWEILQQKYPELRGNGQNYIKDEKGRFAGSRPGSGSGSSAAKSRTSKKSGLTKGSKSVKLDSYGQPYRFPTVWLPPKEYANVMDEIGRWYEDNFKNQPFCRLEFTNKTYYFENHGIGDYNIYGVEDT